jgi:hypothetical protein
MISRSERCELVTVGDKSLTGSEMPSPVRTRTGLHLAVRPRVGASTPDDLDRCDPDPRSTLDTRGRVGVSARTGTPEPGKTSGGARRWILALHPGGRLSGDAGRRGVTAGTRNENSGKRVREFPGTHSAGTRSPAARQKFYKGTGANSFANTKSRLEQRRTLSRRLSGKGVTTGWSPW